MNRNQIEPLVKKEIELWQTEIITNYRPVSISPKAINFIVELVDNINEDPSYFWAQKRLDAIDYDTFQRTAIVSIPEALDYIIDLRRFRNSGEIRISSWEIWQSLTRVLVRFCFIPERDM